MDGLSSDLKCVSSNAQMEANASSLIREKLNAELSELKRWRADAERRLRSRPTIHCLSGLSPAYLLPRTLSAPCLRRSA